MMPDPLRSGLAAAHSMVIFSDITGREDRDWRSLDPRREDLDLDLDEDDA